MQSTRDADILEACRLGDRTAFNLLVRTHQERVFHVIKRIVTDSDDALDIAQEVFIKAFEKVSEFRGDAQIFTWLYRIAVNLSLNHLRKTKLKTFFRLDDDHRELPDASPTPSGIVERDELRNLVQQAVEKLPHKQKAVFVLRYFEELSYEEISAILKTSIGGLKANYHHAVKKIESHVKAQM
ncbi:MAG: sigma-70 family RNA polymerase sigma factor [Bacteroidota bacterium]